MPFTPSHAIVALPFVRTPLVPAAIAVGAMAPDLPLFVRGFGLPYPLTHDLRWLPVTVVLALVLLLVWRCVLRPATRELSPGWLAARLPGEWDAGSAASLRETFVIPGGPPRPPGDSLPERAERDEGSSLRGILLLVASLAIGVASHVLWDLFTHEGRAGVDAIPALDEQWGPLTGYKWLQHGSSAIGLVILAVWAVLWLRRRDAAASPVRVFPAWVRWAWMVSLPAILVFAWVLGLVAFGPLTAEWTAAHLAYQVLPPACALWGAVTLALCVAVQAVRTVRR